MRETYYTIESRKGRNDWFNYGREAERSNRTAPRYGRRSGKRRGLPAPVVYTAGWTAVIMLLFAVVHGWQSSAVDLSAVGENGLPAVENGETFDKEMIPENISASPDSEDTISWNLMLVNRDHPIPDGYEVELVDVPGGEKVDKRIYDPLMKMLDDAAAENLGPVVVSGFRTQEDQQKLYDEKIQTFLMQGHSREEAVELAEQWVSKPGTSEHQSGLAVDINGATYDIYLWLQANSYKYGFIFRYPGNKSVITDVEEEVWHYRFVGPEAALLMFEQGLCLEEYVEGPQTQAPAETAQNVESWYRDGDVWKKAAAVS